MRQTKLEEHHTTAPLAAKLARLMSQSKSDTEAAPAAAAVPKKSPGKAKASKSESALPSELVALRDQRRQKFYPKEVPSTAEEVTKRDTGTLYDKFLKDRLHLLSELAGKNSGLVVAYQPNPHDPELKERCATFDAQLREKEGKERRKLELDFYEQSDWTVLVHKQTGQDIWCLNVRIFSWAMVLKGDKYTKTDEPVLFLMPKGNLADCRCFKELGYSSAQKKETLYDKYWGIVPELLLWQKVTAKPRTNTTKKTKTTDTAESGGEEEEGGGATAAAGDEPQPHEEQEEEPMVVVVPPPPPPQKSVAIPMEDVEQKRTLVTAAASTTLKQVSKVAQAVANAKPIAAEDEVARRTANLPVLKLGVAKAIIKNYLVPESDTNLNEQRQRALQNALNQLDEQLKTLDPDSEAAHVAKLYTSDESTKETRALQSYTLMFRPVVIAGAKAFHEMVTGPQLAQAQEKLLKQHAEYEEQLKRIQQEHQQTQSQNIKMINTLREKYEAEQETVKQLQRDNTKAEKRAAPEATSSKPAAANKKAAVESATSKKPVATTTTAVVVAAKPAAPVVDDDNEGV